MVNKNEFNFKGWFDEEVDQLEKDPEYIAYGLMVDLAAQVAKKLQSQGLKQKDLAERLGKSQGWISRFMNDPTNFSIKKLVEIAVALGMELDVSFKETGTLPEFKPKMITGKAKAGPTRQFSFDDAAYSGKVEKSAQNKPDNKVIAA